MKDAADRAGTCRRRCADGMALEGENCDVSSLLDNYSEFIPAYVYEEDDAHDATWAKMHDVGQNMLDGQASALEVAFFVRNSNMGRDD